MDEYQNSEVENMLRNYYSMQHLPDEKADLDTALVKLKGYSSVLYSTVVSVFVNGVPIQEKAREDEVTRMQVNRRLHDGLHVLTMIMNGEIL